MFLFHEVVWLYQQEAAISCNTPVGKEIVLASVAQAIRFVVKSAGHWKGLSLSLSATTSDFLIDWTGNNSKFQNSDLGIITNTHSALKSSDFLTD